MKWLEEIPFVILIAAAILMAALPIEPQPHLLEKMQMFKAGRLTDVVDILDVLWHLFPTLLLLYKIVLFKRKSARPSEPK